MAAAPQRGLKNRIRLPHSPQPGLVTGHDFSRAERCNQKLPGLKPLRDAGRATGLARRKAMATPANVELLLSPRAAPGLCDE